MDTAYSPKIWLFATKFAGFSDEAYTPELQARLRSPEYKTAIEDWQRKLYEKGWVAPNWPAEYGGTGWTATQSTSTKPSVLWRASPMSCPLVS
ncbi:MAG: hypothetical protein CM15mP25_4020 [Gammaproteobacteria bacterium]|nr:MAG: hypothetical protein CM15mP25_4020 [Gammaproteobacteria bacterium]